MDPTALKAYLDSLCDDLDRGEPLRAVRWAGAALVAVGTMVGCGEPEDSDLLDTATLYGVTTDDTYDTGVAAEDDCTDELDNDGDGLIDCDDDDCFDDPACEDMGVYGAPPV